MRIQLLPFYFVKNFANTKGCIQIQCTEIKYDKRRLKEIFKLAYINKISFLYIVGGYISGVFSKIRDNIYIKFNIRNDSFCITFYLYWYIHPKMYIIVKIKNK